MKIAIIDIGTNTILLLVVEALANQITTLHDEARVVRLGEGIHTHRIFLPQAMERAFLALSDYQKIITKFGCDHVVAIGTAGFRQAANSPDFIKKIQQTLGLHIKVISGDEEARLNLVAAHAEFSFLKKPYAILDIGGGSTELIVEDTPDFLAHSFDFGSVKLTEQFLPTDPPTTNDMAVLKNFVDQELASRFAGVSKGLPLIACAGTATTLAALHLKLASYDANQVHKSRFGLDDLKNLIKFLASMPLQQRQNVPCLSPKRADVIIAGAHILLSVMEVLQVKECYINDRGLRYGVLYDFIDRYKQ